jgi:phospholipid/cholesterol/gamma-HCH transport system substrate-binding protein
MDERVVQFRVGLVVLVTVVAGGMLLFIFGQGPQALERRITVHMVFTKAPMVFPMTPVRKSGVMIGRVPKVQLLDDGRVSIQARIDASQPVFTDDVARISASLIGGDAAVNIEAGPPTAPAERVADGSELKGIGFEDPIRTIVNLQDRLSGAIGSVTDTAKDLRQVINQVGGLLASNQQRINSIVAQTDDASREAKEMVRSVNEVFSPETKAKLKDATEQFPDLVRTTRQTVSEAGKVMAGVDRNLQNLDKFTLALGEQGQAVILQLGKSTQKLDRLTDQMLTLTENINSGKGTIGQLIVDRELYDNLNRTIVNVEEMSRELKPILRDARVFTDKIARHPESLGVRGAIQPSTGTKW